MTKLLLSIALVMLAGSHALAAERKPLEDVPTDDLTQDIQFTPKGAGDDHASLVWWIPTEFWESVMSRDTVSSAADKQAAIDALSGVSILGIVQADITQLGAFRFYPKQEIGDTMRVTYTPEGGDPITLTPMTELDSDLQIMLGTFRPILANAIGNMGSNLHFYVYDDEQAGSDRLLDPYKPGELKVELTKRNGDSIHGSVEMPLNSLFVPRKCPNGKDAHISWEYCPWSGEKL
ncbi:hypothetical protein ACFOZ5_02390 [Marinobacter lacisalsi]|uniref:Uncharacterized protein n=1 Tax=Marinobacter lacisalsi TaxID=475979 RepID=A0ABV8QED3_9GAMM